MVSTTSNSLALMVWVAPNSRAQSSFLLSVSTAMILLAPTRPAPAMAASPDAAAADHRDGVVAVDRCRC